MEGKKVKRWLPLILAGIVVLIVIVLCISKGDSKEEVSTQEVQVDENADGHAENRNTQGTEIGGEVENPKETENLIDSESSEGLKMPENSKESGGQAESGNSEESEKPVSEKNPEETSSTEEIPDMFPYVLEDGKLKITSLFSSSISNPDCDDAYVEDLASIELINLSNEHLKNAKITLKMSDGQIFKFIVEEIPAGKTVWAFESENRTIAAKSGCESVECEAIFEASTSLMEDSLEITAEATSVSITNLTADTLENVELKFHCLFEEVYFGGRTYHYSVDEIAAGETAKLDVWECYLGTAQAVCAEK